MWREEGHVLRRIADAPVSGMPEEDGKPEDLCKGVMGSLWLKMEDIMPDKTKWKR